MHGSFKVKEESLFIAVGILDRYLDSTEVKRKDLDAVVAGAFFLASKYNDIDFIALEDVLEGARGEVMRDQVIELERLILQQLDFDLTFPTTWFFTQRLL